MASTDSSPSSPPATKGSRPTRSSLACLPCRSRHIKCDGKRPHCSRCVEVGKECQYAKSRRGGLDRAALAERRKQLAAAEIDDGNGDLSRINGFISYAATTDNQASLLSSGNPASGTSPGIAGFPTDTLGPPSLLHGTTGLHPGFLDSLSIVGGVSTSPSVATPSIQILDVESDRLLRLYYDNFHIFHPCALPRRHLIGLYRDPVRQPSLVPVIAVKRLIGYLYGVKEWSDQLRGHVDDCLAQACPTDPFTVQARLLYSVALFWHRQLAESKQQMDAAVRHALELGMHRREFAFDHGRGDQVLQECWRRTWWQIYSIDGAFAGTTGAKTFVTMDADATVDLPCEEFEYESGAIPQPPKTLQDFDSREFAPDGGSFSSFAYFVGAARCSSLAIATSPEVVSPETSPKVLQTADSIIDGWLLLLPKNKKEVMRKNGEIDELLFQANLLIHVSIINLHRPLSDLKFNAVEDVSSCAREPPPDTPTPDLVNVHTIRVLRSVEAQIRLLALPARPFNHTPFTTCMVSEGTLALLSACKFLLRGKDLAVARDQIRLSIGCLRAMGDVWARTAKNVQEIQIIARHVLGLGTPANPSTAEARGSLPSTVPGLTGGGGQASSGSDTGTSSEGQFDVNAIDGLCGWFSPGEIGPELSWWVNHS